MKVKHCKKCKQPIGDNPCYDVYYMIKNDKGSDYKLINRFHKNCYENIFTETSHNNDFKTKLEEIYKACNDERVFEIQARISKLLKEISS